jgi:hypothetical protein
VRPALQRKASDKGWAQLDLFGVLVAKSERRDQTVTHGGKEPLLSPTAPTPSFLQQFQKSRLKPGR